MAGLAPVSREPVFPLRDGPTVHRNGSSLPPPVIAPSPQDKRLPEEVAYVLRTTLTEGGVQFLSLQQIDTVIEYFSRERERMTSQTRQQQQQQHTIAPQQSVPSGYPSNYPGPSVYGPGVGQNSSSLHMDKVPDVLKLVQESDVLQKLLAGVMPGGSNNNLSSNHDQSNSVHQGYNPVSNLGMNSGLNASRRGPHELQRGGSGIGGADRGYGGRF